MKGRTFLVLALVGLALVGAAIWLASARQPDAAAPERALLLPGLEAQLNDVERVRIASAEGEAELARTDAGWAMPDRGGWPVDTGKLRTLLLALAEARTVEQKTANPELHAKLGVEAVGEGSGTGARVELSVGDASHAVIVGNANATGSYARLAEQPQSWLLDRRIMVDKAATAWLQRELAQIDASRVAAVRIEHPEGPPVEIEARDPGPGFVIANLPKGREPASDYVAEATAGFLSALRLEDVAKTGEAPFGEGTEPAHARFVLRDGIVVALDFAERDGALLATFDVALDEERAQAFAAAEQAKAAMEYERSQEPAEPAVPAADGAPPAGAADAEAGQDARAAVSQVVPPSQPPPASQGEEHASAAEAGDEPGAVAAEADVEPAPPPLAVSDPEADRAARLAALREEVATLEQRLEGWLFTLPPYKAEHLTKPLSDYLAPETE